jgi:hypothetical protein
MVVVCSTCCPLSNEVIRSVTVFGSAKKKAKNIRYALVADETSYALLEFNNHPLAPHLSVGVCGPVD